MYQVATDKTVHATNMTSSLLFMPIPPIISSKSAPNGGNSLGLSPSDSTLIICLVSLSWTKPADSTLLTTTADALFAEIDKVAKANGLFVPFKYLDYAASNQDSIRGYGSDVVKSLQRVSGRFDPKRFFQNAVPGGFNFFNKRGQLL